MIGRRFRYGAALVGCMLAAGCASPTPPAVPTAQPEPTALPTPAVVMPPKAVAPTPTVPAPPPTLAPTPAASIATPPAPTTSPATPTAAAVRRPDLASDIVLLAVQFESALNRGDVEAGLALLDGDAEVKIPPDLYVGEAQIRGWLDYLAANHFAAEPGFRTASSDRVTWALSIRSDHLDRLGLPSLDGSATLVARQGKIASYTFVLTRESAARHRAAQLSASQVLQDPVIVGLASANIYGFDDVFRDPEGKLISYRDVLTSEPGTGPFSDLWGEPIVVRSGF